MSYNEDSKAPLVPSWPAAVSRTAAASIATRGLCDLSRQDVAWRHTCFNLENSGGHLAISSKGLVASNRRSGSESTHSIAILDVRTGEQAAINSPAFNPSERPHARLLGSSCSVENVAERFSWSPGGRYLLTRSREYSRPVRLYDGCKKEFLGVIGNEPDCNSITWSPDGKWLATAAWCCDWPPLAIWHIEQIETRSVEKRVELDIGEWFDETSSFFSRNKYRGAGFNLFDGFGEAVFSPDSTVIALSATNRLDFAREVDPQDSDDESAAEEVDQVEVYSVVGFDVRSLHQTFRVEVPEPVNSLAWSRGGRLVVCTDGKVAVVEPKSSQLITFPAHATICRSHPSNEWCAFASQQWHWPRSGADERLVVFDLTDFKQVTERRGAGGIYDMAWSDDGKALFAISSNGEFWQCDFPLF